MGISKHCFKIPAFFIATLNQLKETIAFSLLLSMFVFIFKHTVMKTSLFSLLFTLLSVTLMAQTPVALKLNLEKGKTYAQKTVTKQTMQQSVAGQSFNINITATRVTSFKMLSQENDVLELEMKFDTTITSIKSAMLNKETDATKPGKDPVDRIMNKMSLYPIKAKISTAGKFIAFGNYNEFKSNVMLVIDSLPTSKQDEGKKVAETLIKESALRSLVEPYFAHLSDKPLKINDTWESNYITNSNDMSILFFNTYVLKAVENGTALLTGSTEMESMASTNPSIKFDQPIKGTATFEGKVDLKTGLMLFVSEKSQMQGIISANSGGVDYKVDLKVDAQTENSIIQ